MGGIIMWIILGSLVLLVVGFLIVTTILDKKNAKKIKIKHDQLLINTKNAIPKIVKQILLILKNNDIKLKTFVPSIGKLKMKDIKQVAKNALVKLKNSSNFKLLESNEILFPHFEKHINNLINMSSNNWKKKNFKDIDFFINYSKYEQTIINQQKQQELEKELESKKEKSKIYFLFQKIKNFKFKKKVIKNEQT